MLSYRHAFHAGNHADLLKHLIFSLVLEYYNRKDKPYICIDTHAGAGCYDLTDAYAQKTAEYRHGIDRLRAVRNTLSPSLANFLRIIDQATSHQTQFYAGSPILAANLMRQQDYLRLCEWHSTDVKLLEQNMRHQTIRYSISHQDGLKAALAWLPPPNRRAIVLTDPSYEVKSDYEHIPTALQTMHQRCREACLILWYPLLQRDSVTTMRQTLCETFPDNHLIAELTVEAPRPTGMYGSGMFIVNPPYVLAAQLTEVLPELTQLLAQDDSANHQLICR